MGVVRKAFKPEFLNRLDEIVMFDPLGTEELSRIVDIQLRRLNAAAGRSPHRTSRSPRPARTGWR